MFVNLILRRQQQRVLGVRAFGTVAQHSRLPTEKDYYKILAVDATATPEQIKAAYREMAKKFHPDVVGASQGNADRFRDI